MHTFSFINIIPHILLLLFCYLFNIFKIKEVNNSYTIYIGILLFSILRFDVGWDYEAYVTMVERTASSYLIDNIEWLSKILMDIAYYYNFTQLYFIITSIITIYPIYYVSKHHSILPSLSMYLFFCDPIFFLNGLSIVRNASAFSLVFLAYHFLSTKKHLFAIMCIILAGGFHNSGYIGVILILLFYIKLNRFANILIFASSFFISVFVQTFLSNIISEMYVLNKLTAYASGTEGTGPYLKIVIYGITITHLLFWNKLVAVNKNNRLLISIICIGASLWAMMNFAETISLRFCIFFFLFNILLIPNYLNIWGMKYNKIVLQTILIGFAMYFLVNIGLYVNAYQNSGGKIGFIPYKFFFNQDFSQFNL